MDPRQKLGKSVTSHITSRFAASALQILRGTVLLWRYDTEKDTTVDSTHDVFTNVSFQTLDNVILTTNTMQQATTSNR